MNFLIADTFTDSLAKLTGEEQKAVKTTAFDLQMNQANAGMSFHRLDKAKDKNFWSVRVSSDIRLIVHKTESSLLLCYVDHHDKAYAWAERRKLETHPKTGAAQLVEVREMVQEIMVPIYVTQEQPAPPKPLIFAGILDDELLAYGVPPEWLKDVKAANEDTLLILADRLPNEAAEALLELATGGNPQVAPVAEPETDPFEHPDAQRRFRVMTNVEELERALEFPWEKWMIFLHPVQRVLVERTFSGPARVAGSAGTGKTIVALHRAVFLARRNPNARVLLTTFSDTLANALRFRLRRLIQNQPSLAERLEVHSLAEIGRRLGEACLGRIKTAEPSAIRALLKQYSQGVTESRFSPAFLWDEWLNMVDAWQLQSWDEYRDVKRLGRKTRLAEKQRKILWAIFEQVKRQLEAQWLLTPATVFFKTAEQLCDRKNPPFDYTVIDEAQDVGVPELRFLAALGGDRPDSLFFAGDLGQRIFQQPFSWKALGVDVRGRSHTLRINYRTSHQIRRQTDRLLPFELSDVDGNAEDRRGTVSVFNGPEPEIRIFDSEQEEIAAVAKVIPLQERIESIADAADLEDAYNTERHLLYVVCTRARDRLYISGIDPASEFLDDLYLN